MPREGTPAPEPNYAEMTEPELRHFHGVTLHAKRLQTQWGAKAAQYHEEVIAEMKRRGLEIPT